MTLLLALLAVLTLVAIVAAYWQLFLRPYERGMDGFDLTPDDAPRDDSDYAPDPYEVRRRLNGDH